MSTPETRWLGMYNRLGEVLGEDHVETLVSHLGQLATKNDLVEFGNSFRIDLGRLAERFDVLGDRVDMLGDRVDKLSDRVDKLSDRVDRLGDLVATQARHQVVAVIGAMVGLTAIFTLAMAIVR
jgi:hypothetical protein